LPACNFRGVRAALVFAFLPSILIVNPVRAQGGSAVITLVMPVGARQLGMGEAAVAIADDVYGTYWNPSGLAFGPVANEWELMLPTAYRKDTAVAKREFTTLVARPRSGFLLKSIVWAGARDGLLYYNGKTWRDYHEYVMDEGDKLEAVVRRYVGSGDGLDSLVARVKRYNRIKTKQDEEDVITLKLPYNLLFPGQPVRALALDNSDRLWVGTPAGLFRFDGQGWKAFDREEGFTYLPDTLSVREDSYTVKADSTKSKPDAVTVAKSPFRRLAVTALAVKGVSVWIGTEDGLYEYKKNSVTRRGENLLPDQYITSIGINPDVEEIYVGLKDHGLARYRAPKASGAAAKWKIFGTADGLLDSSVTQVVVDKYGHVYAAHAAGVSHFSLRSWEKLHFRNQAVSGLSLDDDGRLWIATSEGAWKFTPVHTTPRGRRAAADRPGVNGETPETQGGDWVHFHTGNGLNNKNVIAVRTQGGDVWFLTNAGIERYHSAKSQVGFFYEGLLPVLQLSDLYHAFLGTTFPIEEWGTLGGFANFVSFGQNLTATSSDGGDQSKFDAYELVAGLTYATRLNKNAGIGVNAKFIYSALSQGVTSSGEKSNGIAASYALDIGFLQKNLFTIRDLSFGMVMQNIGPAVFYVDQAQSDPIPFTWKFGLAYELVHTPNHRFTLAGDLNREAFYRYGEKAAPVWIGAWKELVSPSGAGNLSFAQTVNENMRRAVYNTGAEYVYANVVAVRGGYLYDISGQRNELDVGLGFMLSDILQIDGAFIKSFDNGIRNGQKRVSMILRF
jgi:hypothetical protein